VSRRDDIRAHAGQRGVRRCATGFSRGMITTSVGICGSCQTGGTVPDATASLRSSPAAGLVEVSGLTGRGLRTPSAWHHLLQRASASSAARLCPPKQGGKFHAPLGGLLGQ
jgi:hypothetical protein